jgi:hypothetical protein
VVAENFTPSGERQVARQDQGRVFVSAGNELKEQVRCLCLKGNVTDLINDQ